MSTLGKNFVMKHTFKNVSSMEDNPRLLGEEEEHFGVPIRIYVYRSGANLAFYSTCLKPKGTEKWSVKVDMEFKIMAKNGKSLDKKSETVVTLDSNVAYHGWSNYVNWEEMKRDYLVDDKLTVEARFWIVNMTGFYEGKNRWFDDNAKPFSDMLLTVNSVAFRVNKMFLACQSTSFKTIFFEKFPTSDSLILPNIDSDDFQKFLEVLYGDASIDENNVEGILLIAVHYDAKNPRRCCEEFLVEKSKKSLKKKLQLSTKYGLESLKGHCLASLKTPADVASVLPSDLGHMDRSLLETLLQKAASFK